MITTYCDIQIYLIVYAVKVAQWRNDCLFDAINSKWFAVIILLDQLASGIHHPVTESTHWEFAWCPLEILFEVASVYNPNLCRVLFVGSNKSPCFFLRGKSLSRQFPFGSDRSGGKAEKLAPCDLLLFWTYSKIPLEICWKVGVFVCFSFRPTSIQGVFSGMWGHVRWQVTAIDSSSSDPKGKYQDFPNKTKRQCYSCVWMYIMYIYIVAVSLKICLRHRHRNMNQRYPECT